MRKMTFTKVPLEHITVLQDEVHKYGLSFNEYLKKPQEYAVYYYSITQADTARSLVMFFRPKIESGNTKFRFTITATQAVVLLNACSNASVLSTDDYTANVAEHYKLLIDNQLKSIIAL